MQDLSRFSCNVRLYRDGEWSTCGSENLVPGDIFEVDLSSTSIFPCDAVLLTGDCIVNESKIIYPITNPTICV